MDLQYDKWGRILSGRCDGLDSDGDDCGYLVDLCNDVCPCPSCDRVYDSMGVLINAKEEENIKEEAQSWATFLSRD